MTCTELEKNKSDISSCRKLGRHLLLPKGSQDRQTVQKAQYIYLDSKLLEPVLYFSKLVYGMFGQSKMDCALNFCPDKTGRSCMYQR